MTESQINIYDEVGMESYRKRHRLDPQLIRQFRNKLLKNFAADESALQGLPECNELHCHPLQTFHRYDSEVDGATRLLLGTSAESLVEAVILRITTGRSTVCVSSQLGCAAACRFCATGQMGIVRNLTTSEILDQVLQAGQILKQEGRRLHNIVFMGMGEPFHNEDNVLQAIELLTSPSMFARSPRSILVSTVGIPDAMIRLARRFPDVNQALSLHSAESERRQQLIPLTQRYSLEDLHQAVKSVNEIKKQPLMIEYLMLKNRTDGINDAARLVEWLDGLRVRVNLIPYNPIDAAPDLECSEPDVIDRFAKAVRSAGYETTIRYSLGSDIAAACGQLACAKREVQDADT